MTARDDLPRMPQSAIHVLPGETALSSLPAQVRDTLPLSRIVKGRNPRRYFDRQKHIELVASIRLRGILQPIVVRPIAGDLFEIVCGERRYRAGLEVYGCDGDVPVTIREMTDDEALEAAIDENDARDDASETEQADAAARRLAACGGDRAEAARRLGWSRAKLDRRLALAKLSETVKCALDERRIKVGHAELLAVVPADKQDAALDTILKAALDVAKTRDLLMRVTQDLSAAIFDRSECTTCPFNSASQRTLFETHVDDGHCTNADCFQLKTQTAEAIRFEQEEQAERTARKVALTAKDDADHVGEGEVDDADDETSVGDDDEAERATVPDGGAVVSPSRSASTPRSSTSGPSATHKPGVTATSIARRTKDLREATWRTALARTLAGNPTYARAVILVAAMSGTLSQIRPETLKARADLLVGSGFLALDFAARIETIRTLPDVQSATVLSAIGAAYARDVQDFAQVASLAQAFGVDLRDSWQVDHAFLQTYAKDELNYIARECGLITHIGEKAFAKLLASKKSDLINGMLHRIGFDWAGRLPGAMTLDGQYGPPPSATSNDAGDRATKLAA
ncbi:PRTRC system ParB family protein [Sphingomonas sp. 1185]|uniref:PRTRC system ParB family protein n=1 Tax=Sphingomonas sp. 1185 TaxID=3156411 RepID=UPI0033944DD9